MKLLYTLFKSLSSSSILFDQHHLYSTDHLGYLGPLILVSMAYFLFYSASEFRSHYWDTLNSNNSMSLGRVQLAGWLSSAGVPRKTSRHQPSLLRSKKECSDEKKAATL